MQHTNIEQRMQARFVYVTAGSADEARIIGQTLVQERLAACVNILGGMQSIYWWQGNVESATETVLIAKTSESCIEALIERVKALHSYECPCVITLPILEGNAAYLQWITDSTTAPENLVPKSVESA
jgi:periplasmic divalent cation tolerance protein